jgi:hypothetical protein
MLLPVLLIVIVCWWLMVEEGLSSRRRSRVGEHWLRLQFVGAKSCKCGNEKAEQMLEC